MADQHESYRDPSGGFTLLDGAALVIGAAVGSVHLRGSPGEEMRQGGLVMFWITFAGVALTAAGPFLYLARRFGRRPPGYPRLGDTLWAILGLPWVLTTPLRTSARAGAPGALDLYTPALVVGLGLASLATLAIVWRRWVKAPPSADEEEPLGWTARVGMVLSVAWPVQCAFGLVVSSP